MKLLITRTLTLFIEHHFIARVREPGPTHLKKCLFKQQATKQNFDVKNERKFGDQQRIYTKHKRVESG